jgi:hypothetical protein
MAVTVEWGNEAKTIIVATIDWPWTWDELGAAWKTNTDMMTSVSHTVNVFAVGKTSRFPVGNILNNLSHITRHVPDNLGLAVVVTDNRFQEVINTILFKLSPRLSKTGHIVHTLEEAYALVARIEAEQQRS